MSEEPPICIVCEKVAVEYTRRKWDSPVCYGCLGPGEGPQRRRTDPDFDDRADLGACCRAAVEEFRDRALAEMRRVYDHPADGPARQEVAVLSALRALSAVSGAK